MEPHTIFILGTKLSLCDQSELFFLIEKSLSRHGKMLITSGNIHAYNLAYKTPWLQEFYNKADIMRIDGAGVRLGAKILGFNTPERMTWADFGWDLAAFAEKHGFTLFLLGTKQENLSLAEKKLLERFPKLRILGSHHGYFNKTQNSSENKKILKIIHDIHPNILLVGFGMPLQEKWIDENRHQINADIIFTVGAAFDYLSGELRRAPKWMTNHGLEWLGRMLIEPRRLWKRYIWGNPLFLYRVILQKFDLLKKKKESNKETPYQHGP